MRLAITGAYGSGKSTLVRAAAERFGLRSSPLPAMQNPLGIEKPATHCTPAQLVELTVRRLVDRSDQEHGTHTVSDGSLVHDWVFAKTLLLHGTDPQVRPAPTIAGRGLVDGLLEPTRRAIRASLGIRYDVVVHLPVEFPMDEERPPVTEAFRARSDEYLAEELAAAGIRPHVLRGSVGDRLDQLHDLIVADATRAHGRRHLTHSPT